MSNDNFKINSKALIKNLEDSLVLLKKGVPIEKALNEINLKYGRLHMDKRRQVKALLDPPPTAKYERLIDRIMMKYDR